MNTIVDWPSENMKPMARALALLYQLRGDVVDGCDVICVDRAAKAETVGQERRPKQDGIVAEHENCAAADEDIDGKQQGVDADGFGPVLPT
jgi:hypothetical protein